jgi:hypothetical protein
MPYDIIFITTVLPTLIYAGGGVAAVWIITRAWLQHKRSPTTEELAGISEALEQLLHSVDDLRDDLRAQLTDVRELSGRVEFTERLLTNRRPDDPT